MTDYNDGEWHNFNGSYPDGVHQWSLVTYVWHDERTGKCGITEDRPAGSAIAWSHVLKFRVTKPHREPRVIWVNEYKNGCSGIAHQSPERAKQAVSEGVSRIAVRYVEAPE